MNLYDLAHHPDAFKTRHNAYTELGALSKSNSTDAQFHLIKEMTLGLITAREFLSRLTENEYRMFLLFIHWSTES